MNEAAKLGIKEVCDHKLMKLPCSFKSSFMKYLISYRYNRLKSGASFLLRWNHIYKPIAMQKTKGIIPTCHVVYLLMGSLKGETTESGDYEEYTKSTWAAVTHFLPCLYYNCPHISPTSFYKSILYGKYNTNPATRL